MYLPLIIGALIAVVTGDGVAATAQDPIESQPTNQPPAQPEPEATMMAYRTQFEFDGLDDLPVFLLTPPKFSEEGHKVLIYFVGGGQEEKHALAALNSRVAREAVKRGYVFVAPAAACYECTFVAKGEKYFPQLFEKLREVIPMSEDRFHLMGYSNGGRSSFHIATRHPEEAASITAYPGYLRNQKYKLLENLTDICIVMYVGRNDRVFLQRHRRVVHELKKLDHPVHHKIYYGEGHNIDPLWTEEGATVLMDGLDNRLGCPSPDT